MPPRHPTAPPNPVPPTPPHHPNHPTTLPPYHPKLKGCPRGVTAVAEVNKAASKVPQRTQDWRARSDRLVESMLRTDSTTFHHRLWPPSSLASIVPQPQRGGGSTYTHKRNTTRPVWAFVRTAKIFCLYTLFPARIITIIPRSLGGQDRRFSLCFGTRIPVRPGFESRRGNQLFFVQRE